MGCLKLFEEAERIPWQVHKKGESSSKAYVYAYNNPVNFSDPAGLVPVPMDAGNDDGGSGKSGSGFLAVLTNAWNRAHGARGDGSGMGVSYSGGGRMGWSNGTGYNADGSVHDPSASYTEMAIAMMKLNDSEYGGTWTPGGGISYFNSHEEAVEYGSNYNDHHNAWGNFKGGAKSRKGARDRLYTRKMLAQELKLDLKYALAYESTTGLRFRIYSPLLMEKILNAPNDDEALRIATYAYGTPFIDDFGNVSDYAERTFYGLHPGSDVIFPRGGYAADMIATADADIVIQGLDYETGEFVDIYTVPYWNEERTSLLIDIIDYVGSFLIRTPSRSMPSNWTYGIFQPGDG